MRTPRGFAYAGINCGIKAARKDLALVFSDVPCAAAGCFTVNAARAAPVSDAAARLPADGMRAIVANSGNANALSGPDGERDVREVCAAVADGARRRRRDVLVSASTGVIGVRLPVQKLVDAAPRLAASARGAAIELGRRGGVDDRHARQAREPHACRSAASKRTFAAFAKGAGMIAPELATMLAFVTTDVAVDARAPSSRRSRGPLQTSFDMLTVDGDMSTNDAVFALANGLAGNAPVVDGTPGIRGARRGARGDLRRPRAPDRRGRRRRDEARRGARRRRARRRDRARPRARGRRVEPREGGDLRRGSRTGAACSSAIGARVGARKWPIDPTRATVHVQGTCVYADGAPTGADAPALRAKMREPYVLHRRAPRRGRRAAPPRGAATSRYDYVKINADYTSLTHAVAGRHRRARRPAHQLQPRLQARAPRRGARATSRASRARARSSSTAAPRW